MIKKKEGKKWKTQIKIKHFVREHFTNTSKHVNNWENQSFISLIIAVISNSRLDNKTVGF